MACEMICIVSPAWDGCCFLSAYRDNQAAISFANNLLFYEQTKHIKVGYPFIRDRVVGKWITTSYIASEAQFSDILTKDLPKKSYSIHFNKSGMIDI